MNFFLINNGNSYQQKTLKFLNNNGNGGINQINIACHTCAMPGKTISTNEHHQSGASYRSPFTQSFEPVTFSFYVGQDMVQKRFFENWQDLTINKNDNTINFNSEYRQDIEIAQLDREGAVVYRVTLYDAWPVSIAEIPYSYSQNNEVVSLSVTFEYLTWKSVFDEDSYIYKLTYRRPYQSSLLFNS